MQQTYRGLGIRLRLRADAEAIRRIEQALPADFVPCADTDVHGTYWIERSSGGATLVIDDDERHTFGSLDEAVETVEYRVEQLVAEQSEQFVVLHAGVVAIDRRAVVIPGASKTGKTTLVRELVDCGATYYSDDYALIDESGLVHPYARDLRIRRPEDGVPVRYPPASLVGAAGCDPIPISLVILTRYEPGATWQPSLATPGEGLLRTIEHSFTIRKEPDRVLERLQLALQNARVVTGPRGEAAQVAPQVVRATTGPLP